MIWMLILGIVLLVTAAVLATLAWKKHDKNLLEQEMH